MLEAVMVKHLRDYTLDFTLRAGSGQITVLMGTNGSGKSTTLNIIAGLLQPDTASITLNGELLCETRDGIEIPTEDRRIGYVLQNPAVFPHMTVRDNVAFGLRSRGVPKEETTARAGTWMERVHIADLAGVKAGNLSGGQKQRVALARALATDPGLLMLDEPFTALDSESTQTVKDLTRQYVRDLDIPCILVTHRVADSAEIGDRACVLCQGRMEWEGAPADMPEICSVCHCR